MQVDGAFTQVPFNIRKVIVLAYSKTKTTDISLFFLLLAFSAEGSDIVGVIIQVLSMPSC